MAKNSATLETTKTVKIDNAFMYKSIKAVIKEVVEMRVKSVSRTEPYIRPSMAPACSLPMFVNIAKGLEAGDGETGEWENEESFMSEYYTSVGTTTHEVLQKWFGLTAKLLGNWSCSCKGMKIVKVKIGRTVQKVEKPV